MALESKYVYTIVAVTIIITFIIIFGSLFAFRNKLKKVTLYYNNKQAVEEYCKYHDNVPANIGDTFNTTMDILNNSEIFKEFYKRHRNELGISIHTYNYYIYDNKFKIEFDEYGNIFSVNAIKFKKNRTNIYYMLVRNIYEYNNEQQMKDECITIYIDPFTKNEDEITKKRKEN